MNDADWADQQAKGWLDVKVVRAGGERTVSIYDQARLAQSVSADLERFGHFAETSLVVVQEVTPACIEAAIAAIAARGFVEI